MFRHSFAYSWTHAEIFATHLDAAEHCRDWFGNARFGPEPALERHIRLGVSTYSYWHFKGDKYPIDSVIEEAGRLGFDGVEVLHRQMSEESTAYLNQLKRQAFRNGLDLIQLAIHQDFVSPDAQVRRKEIDHTRRCIEIAAQLGIPSIRLNSGRWKTISSFDDLMKVKGDEPPAGRLHHR